MKKAGKPKRPKKGWWGERFGTGSEHKEQHSNKITTKLTQNKLSNKLLHS